jgi:hypothetical protein
MASSASTSRVPQPDRLLILTILITRQPATLAFNATPKVSPSRIQSRANIYDWPVGYDVGRKLSAFWESDDRTLGASTDSLAAAPTGTECTARFHSARHILARRHVLRLNLPLPDRSVFLYALGPGWIYLSGRLSGRRAAHDQHTLS